MSTPEVGKRFCGRYVLPRELLREAIHFIPAKNCQSLLCIYGGSGSTPFDSYLCYHARELINRQRGRRLLQTISQLTEPFYNQYLLLDYGTSFCTTQGGIKKNRRVNIVSEGHTLHIFCENILTGLNNGTFTNYTQFVKEVRQIIVRFRDFAEMWRAEHPIINDAAQNNHPLLATSQHPINQHSRDFMASLSGQTQQHNPIDLSEAGPSTSNAYAPNSPNREPSDDAVPNEHSCTAPPQKKAKKEPEDQE